MAVYDRLLIQVFEKAYQKGASTVDFSRQDIIDAAVELNVRLPKNLGDVIYSFRYRAVLPDKIVSMAPAGKQWLIKGAGDAKYRFVAVSNPFIEPSRRFARTKIPDSTPGIIEAHRLDDEQAILARVRYNRLLDTFLRITCYSLQNHLRTKVKEIGQIEVDEIYLGLDKRGVQYVIPVQAKGKNDKQSCVQIEQDIAFCKERFPHLVCRPVGAQFMSNGVIALLEFVEQDGEIAVRSEAHFELVPYKEITFEELSNLKNSAEDLD